MKTSFAVLTALLLASAFPPVVYAQPAPPGQPYIQIPIPIPIPGMPQAAPPPPERRERDSEWWEHCEHLRHQERELHERLAYAPPYRRSEKDWSIVCARCITNVNGAVSDDRVVTSFGRPAPPLCSGARANRKARFPCSTLRSLTSRCHRAERFPTKIDPSAALSGRLIEYAPAEVGRPLVGRRACIDDVVTSERAAGCLAVP